MFGGAVTLSMRDVILYVCQDLQFRLLSSMGGSACDRYDSLPFPSWQFPSSLKLPSIYLAPTCKGNPLPSPVHCEGFKRNARRTSTISGHQWHGSRLNLRIHMVLRHLRFVSCVKSTSLCLRRFTVVRFFCSLLGVVDPVNA